MAIADMLDKLMYLTGSSVLRMKEAKAIATGVYGSLPTADADMRGAMARTEGGAGVADQIAFCRKTAEDAYEWFELRDSFTVFLSPADGSYGWTNLGAGPTAPTTYAAHVDLTGYSQTRFGFYMTCANAATGLLWMQYSLNNGSAWSTFIADTDGIASTATTAGYVRTAWVTIPEAARTQIRLRYVGSGGDGAEDISAYGAYAQFRV